MIKKLTSILLFFSILTKSQDKIYLINGVTLNGQLIEIGANKIILNTLSGKLNLNKETIFFIEYKNNTIEKFNSPEKDFIYLETKELNSENKFIKKKIFFSNQASINTLALCNADLTFFYEKILKRKIISIGGLFSYNFNVSTTFLNPFITILGNAKKNYDLGGFINLYPFSFDKKNAFYFGLLLKYSNFNFTKITEEKQLNGTAVGVNFIYSNSEGYQLATLVNFGFNHSFSNFFFIKSLLGIGGFNLNGDYREQYNFMINNRNNNKNPAKDVGFLPKIYLGINAGYNF